MNAPPDDRRRLALLLLPFALLTLAGMVGNALGPLLLVKAPLALIALSPTGSHLMLASPSLGLLPFAAVAAARLFVGDPFMYLLGRDYGDRAIAMLAERMGSAGRALRALDQAFRRASWLVVLVWPGPVVCALAGAARLRPGPFVALNLLGTAGFIALVRLSGSAFASQVSWLRAFIEDNTLAMTVLTASVVALSAAFRLVSRKPSATAPPLDDPPA